MYVCKAHTIHMCEHNMNTLCVYIYIYIYPGSAARVGARLARGEAIRQPILSI